MLGDMCDWFRSLQRAVEGNAVRHRRSLTNHAGAGAPPTRRRWCNVRGEHNGVRSVSARS